MAAAQKTDAASQQPGPEGLSAPLLCRDRPRAGPDFQNSDCSWRFEPGAAPRTNISYSFLLDTIHGNQDSSNPYHGRTFVPGNTVRIILQGLFLQNSHRTLSAPLYAGALHGFLAIGVCHWGLAGLALLANRQSCGHHGDSWYRQFWQLVGHTAVHPVDHKPNPWDHGRPADGFAGNRHHLSVHKNVPQKA